MENTAPRDIRRLPLPLAAEIDRVCVRFSADWAAGQRPRAEDFLSSVEESLRTPLLAELLRVEIDARRAAGEQITEQELHDRFPNDRTAIEEALQRTKSWLPTREEQAGPERIGKYQVLRLLGTGGQARTYVALDPDLKRQVVLKLYFRAETSAQQEQVLREGRALARVQSPYVGRCLSAERDADRVWLVLEYIPGRTLGAILKEGPPEATEVTRLVSRLAEGLAAVHASGLLHRDLKPSNVLIGDDGVPRLIDFGLAVPLASEDLHAVSGTLSYMAPEQARGQGERVDTRTDVFGLGAVLYELITGQPPFKDPDPTRLLELARGGRVTPPREINPTISGAVEAICLKALAPDPAQRYASAAELGQALDRLAQPRRRLGPVLSLAVLVLLGVVSWGLGLLPFPPHRLGKTPGTAPGAEPRSEADSGQDAKPISPRGTLTGSDPVAPAPRASAPGPIEPLLGDLSVQVWSPQGNGPKQGWRVDDSESLPVLNGERVHLQVRLNRAAYVYLLWVTSEGKVLPLYPWKDPKLGFASPLSEPAPTPVVHCPVQLDAGWPVTGVSGLETALLLARDTPLPKDIALDREIGRLPACRVFSPREVVWLEYARGRPVARRIDPDHRDLGLDKPQRIDDPILNVMERLRPHFGLLKAVRFAHQGD
jgi:serine/threonine protein kinase